MSNSNHMGLINIALRTHIVQYRQCFMKGRLPLIMAIE